MSSPVLYQVSSVQGDAVYHKVLALQVLLPPGETS